MKGIKGSLTIEAALTVPIFILVLFSLIYFMKIVYIHERIQYALNGVAGEMAVGAYALDKTGLIDLEQSTYLEAKSHLAAVSNQVTLTMENAAFVLETLDGLTSIRNSETEESAIEEVVTREDSTSLLEKIKDTTEALTAIRGQLETAITEIYDTSTQLIESIQVILEDGDQILISMGAVPGIEIINNAIGTKIVDSLMKAYIKEEDYENWGIIGGEKGMDYFRSSYMLEDDHISIIVQYEIQNPFLSHVLKPFSVRQGVKVRAFTGNGNFLASDFKEPEAEDTDEIVYVTPKGVRYHGDRNCRYINVLLKTLTYGQVMQKETICEACAKKNVALNTLAVVYSTEASDIFHTSLSCWTIRKDAQAVTIDQAVEKKYTPCKICGED